MDLLVCHSVVSHFLLFTLYCVVFSAVELPLHISQITLMNISVGLQHIIVTVT